MRRIALLYLALLPSMVLAQAPVLDRPLPSVAIADRGEILLEDDDFRFRPWHSDTNPGKVHVLQYFAGTASASKIFEPFTDLLQETFTPGVVHVTTVINLDAALWGTTGFVVSEVKASKREFPTSTLVLDEEGVGAASWQLGKKGALLAVLDREGVVRYLSREAMSEEEMAAQLEWLRANATEQLAGAAFVQ